MRSTTYRLPDGTNTRLIDPPCAALPEIVEANRRRLAAAEFTIGGVPRAEAAARARSDAISYAVEYTTLLGVDASSPAPDSPIIATGHQPGFHHPGVWIKNHLVHHLAAKTGACGCNIVLDSDTPTGVSFTLPNVSDDSATVEHVRPFAAAAHVAVEEQRISDAKPIEALRARVRELLPFEDSRSHAERYLKYLAQAASRGGSMAYVFTFARRKIEQEWSLANLELPYSLACASDAFFLLLLEMLARAREFAQVYNSALAAYRSAYRVRGRANPLPDLVADGGRLELPLWIWQDGEQRRPLFIRPRSGSVEILAGAKTVGAVSAKELADPAAGIEALIAITSSGYRIRTKALVSTIYMRLFLFDLFVHGIGGGNYDIITDGIIRNFFGIEPPAYAVATANVSLPFETRQASRQELVSEKEIASHMMHGPYNFARTMLDDDTEAQRAIKQRENALNEMRSTRDRREKQRLFDTIKECDTVLRERLADTINRRAKRVDELQRDLHYNAIVTGREYPFCVYPEDVLRKVYGRI